MGKGKPMTGRRVCRTHLFDKELLSNTHTQSHMFLSARQCDVPYEENACVRQSSFSYEL